MVEELVIPTTGARYELYFFGIYPTSEASSLYRGFAINCGTAITSKTELYQFLCRSTGPTNYLAAIITIYQRMRSLSLH
jgi:hypothetical protein